MQPMLIEGQTESFASCMLHFQAEQSRSLTLLSPSTFPRSATRWGYSSPDRFRGKSLVFRSELHDNFYSVLTRFLAFSAIHPIEKLLSRGARKRLEVAQCNWFRLERSQEIRRNDHRFDFVEMSPRSILLR